MLVLLLYVSVCVTFSAMHCSINLFVKYMSFTSEFEIKLDTLTFSRPISALIAMHQSSNAVQSTIGAGVFKRTTNRRRDATYN